MKAEITIPMFASWDEADAAELQRKLNQPVVVVGDDWMDRGVDRTGRELEIVEFGPTCFFVGYTVDGQHFWEKDCLGIATTREAAEAIKRLLS